MLKAPAIKTYRHSHQQSETGILSHTVYRVIQNDCRSFNNLSYTIHLR